ncbi:24749_t:CDS:2, partial [Racocetra persica]
SSDRNDTALLDTYQPEEIYSQYIIQMAGKGYTVIDHPSKVYKIPMPFLNSFALANYRELKGFTEKVMELVGEPYSKFIDIGLPKTHFNLWLLGSAKE